MAPLGQAVKVLAIPSEAIIASGNTAHGLTYTGDIDPVWTVGSVPNGGYVLALILEACLQYQSSRAHVDPLHVTAHFLRATSVGSFKIHVSTLKIGKGFTNLTAELVQENVVKVTTHLIFGINKRSPTDKLDLTINPPSSYARRHPLYSHPSEAIATPLRRPWNFGKHVSLMEDQEILARNKPNSTSRTSGSSIGGGGLEWGGWLEFVDQGERITNPALIFLADIFINTPNLLPKSERIDLTPSWYPTMTLAVEFKHPIPPTSKLHAGRTVGLYSTGRFVNHPQGRHDIYVEVWTAPSNMGEGEPQEGWRDNQVCLAVATQMALTLPIEVNRKVGRKETPKL